MTIVQGAFSFGVVIPVSWRADWTWGLPLIILTVVVHVFGLGLMNRKAGSVFNRREHRHPTVVFALVLATMTLLATCLHGLEAGIWAAAYQFIGARPDFKSAMLYSLSAMTTYGHENLFLESRWQLMGPIEALNGWLLFGLTTAFLFGVMEKIWSFGSRGGR